jgi:hypothetical protein
MTSIVRHKDYGKTIDEWIAEVPKELPYDAVNLVQILSAGQMGFELKAGDLIDFVHRCIGALLDAGAVPVSGGGSTSFVWVAEKKYGTHRAEILTAILAEWQMSNGDEMYPWGVWFARPISGTNYVRVD